MALETATYISDLVATNPTSADVPTAGDDHLRLIKSTIKASFPSVSGAVTATHTELNLIDGSAADTVVNSKAVIYSSAGRIKATDVLISNDLTFSAGSFITGDLSNATWGERFNVRTSTENANTTFGVVPNGTAVQSQFLAVNNSTLPSTEGGPTDLAYVGFGINDTYAYVSTSTINSGTALPLVLRTGSTATTRVTISATGDVSIAGEQIGIDNTQTPANASATGVKGTICWDENYIYVCTATNTWKRVAISTWP